MPDSTPSQAPRTDSRPASTVAEKTTFTLVEAAHLLTCHSATLRRAIKAGSLRAAKLGKGYRISKADLEEFWKERGGGALFGEAPAAPRPQPKKGPKKPPSPEQLTLPT